MYIYVCIELIDLHVGLAGVYWCNNCKEFHETEGQRVKQQPLRKVLKVKVAPPEPKAVPTAPPSVNVTRITKNSCEIRFANALKVRARMYSCDRAN
jgi:hypothetical protein